METKELNNYKIEFYNEEEWNDYPNNIMLEIRKLEGLYSGLVSDIDEELAEKIVDNKFGETKINGNPIYSYKDYSGVKSKFYPFEMRGDMEYKSRNECWENGGRLTTEYFHNTAKQSFQTLSDLEYCVITKIIS